MSNALDFDAINQAALAAFPAVLNRLLPGGKCEFRFNPAGDSDFKPAGFPI